MKKILTLLLCITYAFSQNINYAVSNIHTLTLNEGKFDLYTSLLKMNDKIDIFNIKKQELGSNMRYDAIGDLTGYSLGLRYGISDHLMVSYTRTYQKIEYSSDQINNKRDNVFLRYNLYQSPYAFFNSGIAVDIGFERNKLDDFYLRDITTINDLIKKIVPDNKAEIRYSDGSTIFENDPFPSEKGYYAFFDGKRSGPLKEDPYIALVNTHDESIYFRVLSGFYTSVYLTDFYIGYKKTKIKNLVTTTDELIQLAADKSYDLEKNLDRYESTVFIGFNHSFNYKKFIFELNYEFERFIRNKDLGYINYNHIINASISYLLTKNLQINIGGKFMYRQFNGQIPYLYNQYTQTSYDHKYGYAKFGIIYSF